MTNNKENTNLKIKKKESIKSITICLFIILITFFCDRVTKNIIINDQSEYNKIFINDYINFDLIWNTGIGFGLLSLEASIFYHLISTVIVLIVFLIIYLIINSNNFDRYIYSTLLGGAAGNLYDRLIYFAVPDFIDLHINNFHWFTFNVADIFISFSIMLLLINEILIKKKNV
jgi:signal peptidase II